MIFLFVVYFFIAIILTFYASEKRQKVMLIFTVCTLTYMIGMRDNWPDEMVYTGAFERAPYPWDFKADTEPWGYAEKGYLFIASLIKMIFNSQRFYLFAMGGISMFLLYKNLTKYCVLPLIGLADYIARFLLNRDFIQMRSSLAILMIVLSMNLIKKKKMWLYFLVIFVAYQFHHMALIGLPFYFFAQIKFNHKWIYLSVPIIMLLSALSAGSIAETVNKYSLDLRYETYVTQEYESSIGLKNPMIWFQIIVLYAFTFFEEHIRKESKYYYIIRTGYLYSTLILIFFNQYTALSGRTSTMFATYEMFLFPLLVKAFYGKTQKAVTIIIGAGLVYFFSSKYHEARETMNGPQVLIEVQK